MVTTTKLIYLKLILFCLHLNILSTIGAEDNKGYITDLLGSFPLLDPLSASEIKQTSRAIKKAYPQFDILFVSINLQEPSKAQFNLLKDLKFKNGEKNVDFPRKSFSVLVDATSGRGYEVIYDLIIDQIVSFNELALGVQPSLSQGEVDKAKKLIRKDQKFMKRIKNQGLSPNLVTLSFWPAGGGYSGSKDELFSKSRLYKFVPKYKEFPEDNSDARPLDFVITYNATSNKIIEILDTPIYANSSLARPKKLILPEQQANFAPNALPAQFYRKSKPLVTSGGPNFYAEGNLINWQKFKFRIGFNSREGLVLYDISYLDGGIQRPLIYRAAVSEMSVPYADTRKEEQFRNSIDEGEFGFGALSSSLVENIDCFSNGKLFSYYLSDTNGDPEERKNIVCVHEVNNGLLLKHTTGEGKTIASKSILLEVTYSTTLGNYDYIFSWKFHQDATISKEVRLTGIVNTILSLEPTPTGSIVAQGVNAMYHQHLYNIRIDPMFDGETNSVATVDIVRPPKKDNGSGTGITTKETTLKTSLEGTTDTNAETDRFWKIYNPTKLNPITMDYVGWKLVPKNSKRLRAKTGSIFGTMDSYARHAFWLTKYRDDELYAGGKYPNQNTKLEGLPIYTQRNESVDGEDIVIWYTFGTTHVPAVEDFPLMSTVRIGFSLKPFNFFLSNPGSDVPLVS